MAYRTTRRVSVALLIFVLLAVGLVAPVSAADCGGATPCSCGDSVIASRKLVRGVDPVTTTPCPGDGLIIPREGVVLDLGWVTIEGNLADGSVGILVARESGPITIRNGTIARFGIGIDGVGPIDGTVLVERGEVRDNAEGGIRLDGSPVGTVVVRTSMARRNGGFGLSVCGDIRDSYAEQNGSTGVISHRQACHGIVSHVVSRENGGAGFVVFGSVDRSLAVGNAGDGYVVSGDDLRVSRSMALSNGGHGFAISAILAEFFQVRTKGNGGFGIREFTHPFFPNFYSDNYCQGDDLGDSDPPGLCK